MANRDLGNLALENNPSATHHLTMDDWAGMAPYRRALWLRYGNGPKPDPEPGETMARCMAREFRAELTRAGYRIELAREGV